MTTVTTITTMPAPVAAGPRRAATFLASTVGRKVIMAATGIILFGFVFGHMIGNMQVYLGAEALNHYAHFLRTFLHGGGIWIARSVIVVSAVLHVWSATTLTLENWKARPVKYRQARRRESSYASRTMVLSGPILFFFIGYHLMHLTIGNVHPDFVEGDVYHNFITGFQSVPASLFYIVGMLALGYHLWHGVWSMLQTLGMSHPRYNGLRRGFATVFTLIIVLGNISFPVAVLTGFLR